MRATVHSTVDGGEEGSEKTTVDADEWATTHEAENMAMRLGNDRRLRGDKFTCSPLRGGNCSSDDGISNNEQAKRDKERRSGLWEAARPTAA